MASYSHDPYQPLHSRRYDSNINKGVRHDSRTSDNKSATAFDEMNGRLQPGQYTHHDRYDTRPDSGYSYPSYTSRASRSKSRNRRSPPRQRRWPPPPKVEEEKVALAREFRSDLTIGEDEAPSRGSIDQEPIILEVPEFIHDRRFVLVPSDNKSHPTPPTSDDERNKRGRRRAPKLETTTLPEMRRESSPYSWIKPTPAVSKRSSGDLFLSPDTITPPPASVLAGNPRRTTASLSSVPPTSDPQASSTRRPSSYASVRKEDAHTRRTSPHGHAGATSSEEDYRGVESRRTRRRSTHRKSFAASDVNVAASSRAKESSQDSYNRRPDLVPSPVISQDRHTNRTTKPAAPLKPASKQPDRQAGEIRSSTTFHGTPTRRSSSRYPPSPPRSPSASHNRSRDTPPPRTSLPHSRPGSQHTSSHSSPQPSPHLSKSSMTADALWGSLAAAGVVANTVHQPKQTSRLSATAIPDPPRAPRSVPPYHGHPPTQTASSLPYPDEETVFQMMPSERDHIYFPPKQRGIQSMPLEESVEPVSRAGTSTTPVAIPIRRPLLSSRNAGGHDFPTSPKSPSYARPTSSSGVLNKLKTPSQLKALARPLPPCLRQGYSSQYHDWFTLEGCPSFDICPDCFGKVFGDTTYRSQFKQSPSRALIGKGLQVKCDFGDAWIRLGWLLTVQRELPSMELIKNLINMAPPSDSDEACPGATEAVRNWYSIRDRSGHFLRGFVVCSADVRRLQILFPGFRELWQPLPMRTSYSYTDNLDGLSRVCSLRPAHNNRFPQYIDTLVSLHEPSYQAGRMPDMSEFVSLVRRKTLVHECTRDDMVREQVWHYIPSLLPAFTVCEDCYDEVILPAIEADADVAMRFNREAQPVYNESRLGSSCQLYSPRMRRVFERAVRDNDVKYLARRAMDRKETEERLQDRVAELRRYARRLQDKVGLYGNHSQATTELAKVDDEMNDLTDEWTRWE